MEIKSLKILLLKRVSLLIFFIFSIGCSEDDKEKVFKDSTNLRLKSYASYTSENPNMSFTYFFNYDSNNKLVNIQSNSLGSNVDFEYDNNGKLIQVGDYSYLYNSDDQVYQIKNENLLTSGGKYEGTILVYTNGKATSINESFINDFSKKSYTTDISYNNKEQIRSILRKEKDFIFESEQEYVVKEDKGTYKYDSNGNIQEIIYEENYNSYNLLEFKSTYSFDFYNNPIRLIQKSTGVTENLTMIYLGHIADNSSFFLSGVFNYFTNNILTFTSIPQTSNDNYVQYVYERSYEYNEYGYPISAEEITRLLNRDIEYTTFYSYEYEEF